MKYVITGKNEKACKYIEDRAIFWSLNIESMRGHIDLEIKLEGSSVDTSMWTPVMFAIALKQLDAVVYMAETLKLNTGICFKAPLFISEYESKDYSILANSKLYNSSLALMLAVNNYDLHMLNYLWHDHYYLWDIDDLDRLVDSLYASELLDTLDLILSSKAFKNIILSMPFEDQIYYIEKILFDKFDRDTQ